MIANISGKIIANNGAILTVMTAGGVGYKIFINPGKSDRWPIGSEANILTHLSVREDAMDLFGFNDEQEKTLFKQLLSVSGIGPKSAMHLLSLGETKELSAAIAKGDLAYLTKVSGIGKKTAERIVVELKNKMVDLNLSGESENGKLGDVVEGLISLGYNAAQAREAIKDLPTDLPSEQLMRRALKRLGK